MVKNTHQRAKAMQFCLTQKQVHQMINASDNIRDRIIIELLAFSGCRRKELTLLKVSNLDLENDKILMPTCKRRADPENMVRQIPIISTRLKQDIQTYLELWRTKYSLKQTNRLIQQASKTEKDGISRARINQIVAQVAEKAGIKSPNPNRRHVHPHMLRHSFVRFARQSGMNFKVIQELMGHASISTTFDLYGAPTWHEISSEATEKLHDFANFAGGL